MSRSDKTIPLREQRKRQTRHRIVQSATALFRTGGFAGTTLDQIAARADVHKITVLRHFVSKEAIAFDYQDALVAALQAELDMQQQPVIEVWRSHIGRSAQAATRLHALIERWEFVNANPSLIAYQMDVDRRYQEALALAFSAEAGLDPETDIFANAVAALLVGGNSRAAHTALQNGSYDKLEAACQAVVDIGERMLRDRQSFDSPAVSNVDRANGRRQTGKCYRVA